VVPEALRAVPWHLLPALARRPVAVAPSATWWYGAQSAPGAGQGDGTATVVAGPRLAEADNEAVAVAGRYPRAELRTGAAATAGAVLTAVPHTGILHLACHARVRTDNPLWSSLELSDGPLWAYDLERLPRTPPTVVLSGCHTGVGVRAGDDILGLASALLRHDTRQVVAGVCRVPDTTSTVDTMTALHGRLAAGASPATALAELSAGAVDPDGVPLGAYLTCFGTT
jgi:CHAT domain-containing protein